MDIEALLLEKIKRFEDIKTQVGNLSKQIGALTEQQRAFYNQGLELKGAIDSLLQLKEQAKTPVSETAKLTLPAGVSPVVPMPAVDGSVVTRNVPEGPVEAPKSPLEVI